MFKTVERIFNALEKQEDEQIEEEEDLDDGGLEFTLHDSKVQAKDFLAEVRSIKD